MLKIFTPVDGKMVEAHNTNSAERYVRYNDIQHLLTGMIHKIDNAIQQPQPKHQYPKLEPLSFEEIESRCCQVVQHYCEQTFGYEHGRFGPIKPETQLELDLGLDSLDQVELLIAIEDHFNVMFENGDNERVASAPTVKEMAQAIKEILF